MPGRLVLLVPAFPRVSETFIASKFRGLLELGWDIHVVCGRSEQAEWDRFSQLPDTSALLRRVHVSWRHHPRWLAALLVPAALVRCLFRNPRGTWRYVKRGWRCFGLDTFRRLYLDAEVIGLGPGILHFEFGALAVGRMYLKDLLDCMVVVSFRGYDLNYVGLEQADYYGEVWNSVDALHFLGEDLRQRALRRGCPAGVTHTLIPPAIDTSFFDPGSRDDEGEVGTPIRPLRILSVGRLEWKKGYEHALQAIRRLLDSGIACEYRIIGGGDYLEAVAFARHGLALEGVADLMGACSPEDIKRQMRRADVFLHAAVSEGFCNAVLEAQAMALPVVSSDADGLRENISDEETGFVVARRDPEALAAKLAVLARDPDLRRRMGKAGRRRVLTHYSLSDQTAAFDRLYRQVLALGGPAREKVRFVGAGREAVIGK